MKTMDPIQTRDFLQAEFLEYGFTVEYWDFAEPNSSISNSFRFLIEDERYFNTRIKIDYIKSKDVWVYNFLSPTTAIFSTVIGAVIYAKTFLKK